MILFSALPKLLESQTAASSMTYLQAERHKLPALHCATVFFSTVIFTYKADNLCLESSLPITLAYDIRVQLQVLLQWHTSFPLQFNSCWGVLFFWHVIAFTAS